MNEFIAIITGIIGIMTTFWFFSIKHLTKIIDYQLNEHQKDNKAHIHYLSYQDFLIQQEKLNEKLDKMNEELIKIREEFHIFKEKICTKINI